MAFDSAGLVLVTTILPPPEALNALICLLIAFAELSVLWVRPANNMPL